MRRPNATTPRRPGFTLAELVVVLGIILLLVSLIAGAVLKFAGQGDVLKARHEISNLALAINNFKTVMKVDYIPSRFRLREQISTYNLNDKLDAESYAYLKKLFPKLSSQSVIDWNNNGVVDGAVDLEGHQCLIFFLGGIPSYGPNTCNGFSTNPSNPAAPGGERINGGPFYNDFKADRLVVVPTQPLNPQVSIANGTQAGGAGFFSYLDPWAKDINDGNVYAYFSSYTKNNGYNRYYNYYLSLNVPAMQATDCPFLTVENYQAIGTTTQGLWPYAQKVGQSTNTTPEYLNPNTFQILCAGPNKVFGQGTVLVANGGVWTTPSYVWTTATANVVSPLGQDDYSNFHDKQLGSGD
jgi:prepilin-type N-terminal cleavage/methylation domain-containing protein